MPDNKEKIERFRNYISTYHRLAANVFVLGMRDELMRGEILAGAPVDTTLVGHERAFRGDVGPDDRRDIAHARGVDMEGTGFAAGDYRFLRWSAAQKAAVKADVYGETRYC
ncbi:hypothetical protein LB565_13720 [Mesorhizobium sp. CA14]|uniref:hypothetical protein n=1 Tax=Mesorhizobium sp. CA14 TaxID=2876642 RepID=UPI001CCB1B22|nr:hypothetical protein [Mesorhizobium sp. CA14]MBZ9849039.1 hypothetical protein [Mesorhizobium sp. CA14]